MGALGTGLALPFFSLPAQATTSTSADALRAAAAADASVMARWHDYARSSITPQFSWALEPQPFAAPNVLDNYFAETSRPSLFGAANGAAPRMSISVATGVVADTPSVLPAQATRFGNFTGAGLQRTVVAPSLVTHWGENGDVRLTGIFAYQRFASIDVGMMPGIGWGFLPAQLSSSFGAGARIDFDNTFGDRLRWNVGLQSRVGMSPMSSYRGVFADEGDFDIPASATVSLNYLLTPEFSLDAGVQHVQYSAIKPFTSPDLPRRFLALLGDSSSPVFAWRDLDVYSVGWTWRQDAVGNLQLRYTTRQQPIPTSRLLENALAPVTANRMLSMGWWRSFGPWNQLSFQASYADSPYYLLMPSYVSHDDATAGRFEFQAWWSTRF